MAFATVGGCTRVSQLVYAKGLAIQAERAPAQSDSVQLTAAVMPTLAFSTAGDVRADSILPEGDRPLPMNGLCPADMASIDDRYCIDKYEAALLEVTSDGNERSWPYYEAVDKVPAGSHVRAISEKGVFPQGYISGKQAAAACKASGKRLCKPAEWTNACKGPDQQQYGYANKRSPGTCNDNGKAPIGALHFSAIQNGTAYSTPSIMNDPQLNQLAGTLAETGSHESCTNGYGVYDMVGNIHEWVDDPRGAFQGGYYLDVEQNGEGCGYKTDAHRTWYHDYSTGFRCCADPGQ